MSLRARALTIAGALALAGMGAWTFTHLEVTTEITAFFPSSDDRELAQIARDMTSSDLNRTITITIGARDPERAVIAARDLGRRLERNRDLAWVRRGPDDNFDRAFYDLYFPRRLLFYSDDPNPALDDEALGRAARDLKQRLLSPTGTFVRQIAPSDPLLAFPRHLDRMRAAQQGGLQADGDQFVTADGRHAVIFASSRSSPFDAEASQRLIDSLEREFRRLERMRGDLEIEQSGVHRFAVRSRAAIQSDVTRVSTISTVAIFVLFLVLFRSLRYVLLSTVPLVAGMIVALFVSQLVFGRVHGLGLAFGSTLIGVGVDFVAHYMNHHVLAPSPEGPWGSLKRILPGLALGAGTTIAGLAGLAWTSFPGMRELAVFTSVGVSAALIATCVFVPPWLPLDPRPTRVHAWIARSLTDAIERMRGSRLARFALPVVALAICAIGLPQLRWVDDIRALNALDRDLVREDERVRARVTRMDAGRFVIAWGANEEQALVRNDEVSARLAAAERAGELESHRSLHALLWSARAQRASQRAILRSPRLAARVGDAMTNEGFVASAFDPFVETLRERPAPLSWDDLAASPLGPLVESFRVESQGRVGFVTLLRGGDLDALERRLEGMRGVRLFDQNRFMEAAYGEFRTRTIEMVIAGLVIVFLVIFARYRRLAPSIAAFAPAILASLTSLAVLAIAGYEANLMHLLAILLVLSMGEDYGVFVVEARIHTEENIGNTLTSILIACVTTVLSFGLLAMSDNPALRALGFITGTGVFCSLVLAPVAWLFLAPEKKERTR